MVSQSSTRKILVFHDQQYPHSIAVETLHRLLPGSFQIVDAAQLATELHHGAHLLVSFHGAYFPKASWRAILNFLEKGGHLAVFGGMPFAHPVNDDGEIEPEQDAYTRQLHLGPFFQVADGADDLELEPDGDAPFLRDCPLTLPRETPGTFWACYPKLTQTADHPEELGSSGAFDTLLQPLIYALAPTPAGKRRVATPAFLLDQQSGRFRGGRWLICAWQPHTEADWLANTEALHRLIRLANEGSTIVEVHPTLGCYRPGEVPALVVSTRTTHHLQVRLTVYMPEQADVLQTFLATFEPSSVRQEERFRLPAQQQPGLYRVIGTYQVEDGQPLGLETGFWLWDEALVDATHGRRLTAGRDYLYQHQQPFLVYGTTYMDSRVQRKFLHLPNPARWDREMAEMKAAGINLIRTGLWTAWREFVPMAGIVNEAFLRAFDAFVMTACAYDLQLIFTFFAFFPPLFEGENPWLDPRAIEAQQDFVALLAHRYADVELLSWDLINEPSFGDPQNIFSPRPLPNHDRFEVAAFQSWLAQHYTLSDVQMRWRQTPADLPDWEHVLPPQTDDFHSDVRETQVRTPLKVADYTRFSQHIFHVWADSMRTAIRSAGGKTLVGVGQDEAGARISPQFYASAVDYTTTHPWWNIDDLLWDMLLDKTLEKPNLIQETGVMFLLDLDGRPWRSEQASAHLLERKLVTGLIARGAGLVQWLWHTNAYMTSDNENGIGLVRADGSTKPELAVMEEFGRLVNALQDRLLEAPSPPDVWVVIPYAQWFARPAPARDGTQQAVRVLGYELGIVPQMVGEDQLALMTDLPHQPRAVIVPAAQLLDHQAWRALARYVQHGGTLLVDGVLGRDAYNLPFALDIAGLTEETVPQPLSRSETLHTMQGQTVQVSFTHEKISYLKKSHNQVRRYQHGDGLLFWCGLPLELADETAALKTLYQHVLQLSDTLPSHNASVLLARQALRDGTLILGLSESNSAQHILLDEGITITLEAGRAGALILETDSTRRSFGGLHIAHE